MAEWPGTGSLHGQQRAASINGIAKPRPVQAIFPTAAVPICKGTPLPRMLQDMVLEQQGTLKELLAAPNSHIYICGDSNMAAAVSAAFAGIIGEWL